MPGCNVDVTNNPPTVAELQAFSIDAVRLVSKPDPNGPGVHRAIEQYLDDLKAAGIFALVIITPESQGRLPANNHGWFQFGNEPDITSPSSATMTSDDYVAEFNKYSETYPQFNWIAAGLAAGDYQATYWTNVCSRLVNCVGVSVHPYGKSPDDAATLVQAHQIIDPTKLAFVTEFNCTAAEIPDMLTKLKVCTAGQYWFAWNSNVPDMGLCDHPDKAEAWKAAATPVLTPEPELWVDLSNFQGALTQAMADDMKAGGVVGVCSQAITGLDGRSFTRQQLTFAQTNGLRLAGYVWAFGGSSVARRLPMFDGFPLEWLALDAEDDSDTIASINRDLDLCDAYQGSPAELYSAYWFFARMRWLNVTRWAERPLWAAIYDGDPDPTVGFIPFGGFVKVRTKQFTSRAVYGGVTVDLSTRAAA